MIRHQNMTLQAVAEVVSSSGSFKVRKELYFGWGWGKSRLNRTSAIEEVEVVAELDELVAVNG